MREVRHVRPAPIQGFTSTYSKALLQGPRSPHQRLAISPHPTPQADPCNSGEQGDHSRPSEHGVSDPKYILRKEAAAESIWELLLVS